MVYVDQQADSVLEHLAHYLGQEKVLVKLQMDLRLLHRGCCHMGMLLDTSHQLDGGDRCSVTFRIASRTFVRRLLKMLRQGDHQVEPPRTIYMQALLQHV